MPDANDPQRTNTPPLVLEATEARQGAPWGAA